MDLKTKLEQLFEENHQQIGETHDLEKLNQIRVSLLGKKGPITEVLRGMKDLSQEERPKVGAFANKIKADLQDAIAARKQVLENAAIQEKLAAETLDVTLPGDAVVQGTPHILAQIMDDVEDFFIGQGYQVVDGPEVEEDHYNFEMLNIPKDHPARDMQDTFYIDSQLLMRSQTSPVQARTMEIHDFKKGPLKMISPGRVYRRDDDDATHSHQFHQIEGLVIDKHITMADLKGTLLALAQHVFGADRQIRLRPSFFPFTEPSVEVDVSCFRCNGAGCPICKYSGWIEVLGAGMVHPNVLNAAGVDADVYGGFAFGLGPDRFAMLKYGIDDIRSFYQGDLRFLSQFQQEG
ncbi:phenylalanine--tRNA ligase subunit alpha [Lacticaseibacillus kribbianus]|uniref:phenylalanine--tRNA ligase subunit alpha n=1 Tax=Lacticaseibacillus kribbianus TaxID=2926292 RepID=UPI001CD602B5|nr:phenylalanine--tRNA ligase subunit alpha [Lacticaseibacillus kribbianus]